jgi:hypothetical protein
LIGGTQTEEDGVAYRARKKDRRSVCDTKKKPS